MGKRVVNRKLWVRCLGPCKEHHFWSEAGERICPKGRDMQRDKSRDLKDEVEDMRGRKWR